MTYEDDIQTVIDNLNQKQGELLLKRLSATFIAGFKQANNTGTVGDMQRRAIKSLVKEQMGYLTEFNQAIGDQLTQEIKSRIAAGEDYAQIKKSIIPYIEETFGENGKVTIDRVGQSKEIIVVDQHGNLSRKLKEISRKYTNSVQAYSDMLSRTSVHSALVKGQAEGYKARGYTHVRFVGSNDERSRDWHRILLGNVYKIDSDDYYMALDVLSEPNCRHWFEPYFDDPKYDTPQSFFDGIKKHTLVSIHQIVP
jgi:hypothetical protein